MTVTAESYSTIAQNGRVVRLSVTADLEQRVSSLAAEMLDGTRLHTLPRIEPLIVDTYGRHSYVVLAGRDGTYKSFVALDFALCHATGKPWLGTRTVVTGPVLYLLGEGAYGLQDRITAWEEHYGLAIPTGMLTVLPRMVRLFNNADEIEALIEFIRRGRFVLVIIDTLRRAAGGAKGNSNDDMGAVVDAIEDIKRATDNGSVLVLAHTDDGDTKVRGATNIEDDADYVYRTQRTGDNQIKLWRTKNKYGPESDTHHLRTTLVAESLVIEPDGLQVIRMESREQAVPKLILGIIENAGGTVRGFNNLRNAAHINANQVRPAVEWLNDNGYIDVRTEGRSNIYAKLRDWGTGNEGS